jgi:hypothetical protein
MSDQISNILNEIKASTDFQINKTILKEKISTDLHFVYNQGLFKSSIELISFLSCWEDDVLVIPDSYETPIKVNRVELLSLAKQHYQKQMNFWLDEYEKLRKIRKI